MQELRNVARRYRSGDFPHPLATSGKSPRFLRSGFLFSDCIPLCHTKFPKEEGNFLQKEVRPDHCSRQRALHVVSGAGGPVIPHVGLACSHGEPGDLEEQRCGPGPVSI